MSKGHFAARIRIHHPEAEGRLVLRTELDWERDVEPVATWGDGAICEFRVEADRPFLAFKPCLRSVERLSWAVGPNRLAFLGSPDPIDFYPFFRGGLRGRITEVIELDSLRLGRTHRLRLYLPPGYDENTLKRYPVLYMHDGRNLFFPEEAFLGQEWEIDENLDLLSSMSLVDQTIVVGLWAEDREHDYTRPGYERFGASIVGEVRPWLDAAHRTLQGPDNTAVMGSSLGGVASFYLGWEHPEVFGNVGCLSSTFSARDDLLERVRSEPLDRRRHLKIYLDSGWPGDNYEVTLSMAHALLGRGFVLGRDFLYFAFPLARHDEGSWAARCHLPIQLFSGRLRRRNRELLARASIRPPDRGHRR